MFANTGAGMRVLAPMVVAAAMLAGCRLFPKSGLFAPVEPTESPLVLSLKNYQSCVAQSQGNLNRCERLRLAYEAQLDKAEH